MSPPEIWGPAVWNLFHTLAEKVNENAYPYIAKQLFSLIFRICRFLPCPECSNDASNFLAKVKIENVKTKNDFKQTFYLFHNYVNAKKRKPLFNYSSLVIYNKYKLIPVVNNFIICYNTKGNMKLLNDSFQRQIVLRDFKMWFSSNIKAFFMPISPSEQNSTKINFEPQIFNNKISNETDDVVIANKEETVVEHTEEHVEPVEEPVAEVVEQTEEHVEPVEEPVTEVVEEVEEPVAEVVEPVKEPVEEPVAEVVEPVEEPVEEAVVKNEEEITYVSEIGVEIVDVSNESEIEFVSQNKEKETNTQNKPKKWKKNKK